MEVQWGFWMVLCSAYWAWKALLQKMWVEIVIHPAESFFNWKGGVADNLHLFLDSLFPRPIPCSFSWMSSIRTQLTLWKFLQSGMTVYVIPSPCLGSHRSISHLSEIFSFFLFTTCGEQRDSKSELGAGWMSSSWAGAKCGYEWAQRVIVTERKN